MARIAAVDVGTNTALLVVADFVDGALVPLVEVDRFVRLGEGVDQHRLISAPALDRLERVLREFREIADASGATEGLVGATSASRDASNRPELVGRALAACGWPYEILSGETEAALTFAAAATERVGELHADARTTVLDVGGGSTELVVGLAGPPARVLEAHSVNIGSVRIRERFLSGGRVDDARRFVEEELLTAAARTGPCTELVGVGGTATTIAGLIGGGRGVVPLAEISAWMERLLSMSPEAVLALNPALLKGREDVFAAGVLITESALRAVGADRLVVSRRGLRHGLALRYFGAA